MAAQVRLKREKLGISASELARRAGVDTATVTRFERGLIRSPRTASLVSMAAVLGIGAADLFTERRRHARDDELPAFSPYMRKKYDYLPDEALEEMQAAFDALLAKYGHAGPLPGQDEY